ncbi:MAG: fibronectin, partial [Candidatus Marinimicrobia bacterium]|nr:fibronectin [Candidatus Neomarinimicrobiota bacterium]
KDKLMFYNLPENCEIRIFTERGDLVDVLDHITMEGMAAVADEAWNSSTASRQVIKSGIYIAHIRVTKDINETETGLPLLFEGESVIKKFIIIR